MDKATNSKDMVNGLAADGSENTVDTVDMTDMTDMTDTTVKKVKKKGRLKKRLLIILGVLLGIILIAVIAISIIAGGNVKAMNECIDTAMAQVKKNYTVTPIDAGEYEEMTIYGIMKFDVEQYYIEELGNLSIMKVNMGVMQMATFVITPQDKNMPLMSVDYMYILGNRKCYIEFYDVVESKDATYMTLMDSLSKVESSYDYLDNIETSSAWYADLLTVAIYKGGGSENDSKFKDLLSDSLSTYLEHSRNLPVLSAEEREKKLAITVKYTDGLIEKGGISTDVFKDSLGDKETKKFFDTTFFGTSVNP